MHRLIMHHLHLLPLTMDALSIATLAAWYADIIPSVATTLTAGWVAYQIIREIYNYLKKR